MTVGMSNVAYQYDLVFVFFIDQEEVVSWNCKWPLTQSWKSNKADLIQGLIRSIHWYSFVKNVDGRNSKTTE